MPTESKPPLPLGSHEPPGFEPRALSHAGASVRYLVGGSGPPIVLVHGLGGAASNWLRIAPALVAAGWRVIVPELPGHGGSEPFPEAPTLDSFAEAVVAVLEHEHAVPAPWIGHSFGGLVGLRAAVRRPDAVLGLVLAAAAGISSATRTSELMVTCDRARPAAAPRDAAPQPRRARWGRTLAFGWWAVADRRASTPEMAEAFLDGPALHTDTRPPAPPDPFRPPPRPRPGRLPARACGAADNCAPSATGSTMPGGSGLCA